MDYILQNMQYRYMENVIQQINRGAVQNVTTPSLSGLDFAHFFLDSIKSLYTYNIVTCLKNLSIFFEYLFLEFFMIYIRFLVFDILEILV